MQVGLTEQLEQERISIHYDENLDKIPVEIKSNTADSIVIYTPILSVCE